MFTQTWKNCTCTLALHYEVFTDLEYDVVNPILVFRFEKDSVALTELPTAMFT